jgi:uncharacterized membrane protein YgcG
MPIQRKIDPKIPLQRHQTDVLRRHEPGRILLGTVESLRFAGFFRCNLTISRTIRRSMGCPDRRIHRNLRAQIRPDGRFRKSHSRAEITLMKLFVGNLPFSATENEIRDAFEAHGEVSDVAVITDRETGRPRGFAFVEMSDSGQANAAIEALNGQDFGGRSINVNEARPREDRPRGGGGGGYGGGGGGGRGGGGGGGRGGWR